MKKISLTDLKKYTWNPRHYVEADGINYGYDKCAPPELALSEHGIAVDLVRLKSGHVIPEHYHERAEENFTVLWGNAIFQTRDADDDPVKVENVSRGDIIRINPRERHRVVNSSKDPLYLYRTAK